MAAPRVRLIVLNFNGGDDVLRCVEHLYAVEWPRERLDIVVVDNASTDGSAEALAAAFPGVRLVRSPVNRGFPANNLAFDHLDGVDYVGLVNNDAFVEPGYLGRLVDALAADAGLGAACPKIVLSERFAAVELATTPGERLDAPRAIPQAGWFVPDDMVDPRPVATGDRATVFVPVPDPPPSALVVATDRGRTEVAWDGQSVDLLNNVGNELTGSWFGADRGLFEPDDGRYDEPTDVFAWCGAAVLFPSAYLRDVGGFDERLFLYYEDLDLAWRGARRGWRYRTVPDAVVRHRLGASSNPGSPLFRYHVERNRLVVLAKHAPVGVALGAPLRHLAATASYAWRDVGRRLLRGRRPAPALAWLRLRALGGYLRLLPQALRERRRARPGRVTS